MSGTGVQSAMRRRTRPAEDPRRQTSSVSSSTNGQQLNQTTTGANQRLINPGQILYMHETKIRDLEKSLTNIGAIPSSGGGTDEERFSKLKTEIESGFEKRLTVINNNLNFLLNALNEETAKTKNLEATIQELTRKYQETDKNVLAKLDRKEFIEFRDEYNIKFGELTSKNKSGDAISVETNTIETVETVYLGDTVIETLEEKPVDTELDAPVTSETLDVVETLKLDTEILEQLNTLTMDDVVGADNEIKDENNEFTVNY